MLTQDQIYEISEYLDLELDTHSDAAKAEYGQAMIEVYEGNETFWSVKSLGALFNAANQRLLLRNRYTYSA